MTAKEADHGREQCLPCQPGDVARDPEAVRAVARALGGGTVVGDAHRGADRWMTSRADATLQERGEARTMVRRLAAAISGEDGAGRTRGGRRVRLHAWIPALYTASATAAGSVEQQAPWSMLQGFGFLAVTAALLRVGLRAALTRAREAHQRLSRADRDGSVAQVTE